MTLKTVKMMNERNVRAAPVIRAGRDFLNTGGRTHTHAHAYTRKGLLTRGGEEMRGVALNERVRASVKEPGRVETGKSRLYLPEDGEGGRARRRRDAGGVGRRRVSAADGGRRVQKRLGVCSGHHFHPSLPLLLLRRSTMKIVSENNAICRDAVGRKLCRAAPGLSCARRPDKLCQGLWCLGRTRVPPSRPRRPGGRNGGVKKKKKRSRRAWNSEESKAESVNESYRSKEATAG